MTACHRSTLRSLISTLPVLLLVLSSQAAQAVSLQIDPVASHVTYTPASSQFCLVNAQGEVECPPPAQPETFALAGGIDLGVTHEHLEFDYGYPTVDRDLIQLLTRNLVSAALDKGFSLFSLFPAYGLITGETFYVSDEPCFLFVGPGSCSGGVIGTRTGSTGTWDGTTLLWSGYRTSWDSWSEGFTFDIRATTVPEPGTLSLLLLTLGMMTFAVNRRRSPFSSSQR